MSLLWLAGLKELTKKLHMKTKQIDRKKTESKFASVEKMITLLVPKQENTTHKTGSRIVGDHNDICKVQRMRTRIGSNYN